MGRRTRSGPARARFAAHGHCPASRADTMPRSLGSSSFPAELARDPNYNIPKLLTVRLASTMMSWTRPLLCGLRHLNALVTRGQRRRRVSLAPHVVSRIAGERVIVHPQ